jgi:hypothetical protein
MEAQTVITHALTQDNDAFLSSPSVLAQGVSLAKASDAEPLPTPVESDPFLPMLGRGLYDRLVANDLRALDLTMEVLYELSVTPGR